MSAVVIRWVAVLTELWNNTKRVIPAQRVQTGRVGKLCIQTPTNCVVVESNGQIFWETESIGFDSLSESNWFESQIRMHLLPATAAQMYWQQAVNCCQAVNWESPGKAWAFLDVCPRIWKDLRTHTTSADSLPIFCQQLKTHLFSKLFPGYFQDIYQPFWTLAPLRYWP